MLGARNFQDSVLELTSGYHKPGRFTHLAPGAHAL